MSRSLAIYGAFPLTCDRLRGVGVESMPRVPNGLLRFPYLSAEGQRVRILRLVRVHNVTCADETHRTDHSPHRAREVVIAWDIKRKPAPRTKQAAQPFAPDERAFFRRQGSVCRFVGWDDTASMTGVHSK